MWHQNNAGRGPTAHLATMTCHAMTRRCARSHFSTEKMHQLPFDTRCGDFRKVHMGFVFFIMRCVRGENHFTHLHKYFGYGMFMQMSFCYVFPYFRHSFELCTCKTTEHFVFRIKWWYANICARLMTTDRFIRSTSLPVLTPTRVLLSFSCPDIHPLKQRCIRVAEFDGLLLQLGQFGAVYIFWLQ